MSDKPSQGGKPSYTGPHIPGSGNGPAGPGAGMRPGRPGGMGGMGRGGPMAAMMKGDKAKDFKGTMKQLLAYLGAYKATIIGVFLLALASTVFMIAGPKILGEATTRLFEGVMAKLAGTGDIDFAAIGVILLWVLGLYLVSTIFSWIMGWIMARVATDITYRLRADISRKMSRIPLGYYDRTNHGQVLSRITNDVDTVNQTLSQSLTQIITSVVTVLGVLVMMLSISWLMTLVALLVIPLSMVVVQVIVKQSQKYFKGQQQYLGALNGHVEEMFSGHVVMKAFNGEKRSIETFNGVNGKLYDSAWKSQFFSGLMMPIMGFVGNLGYVAVTVMGGWLVVQKAITVGDIQAFIQYVRSFTQPITQIANISNVLQQTAAAAERVFEFLDEAEESADPQVVTGAGTAGGLPGTAEAGALPGTGSSATALPATPQSDAARLAASRGLVEFREVRFGYTPGVPVIKGFSALAKPGQKIAIVGPTGAGKTTMVKLLMRFYDLDSGAILLDGKDIKSFSRNELRSSFAMVLQDTWLYNADILENIRYGRPDATDEEVYAAARAAHADHFIHTLPEGYHMVINEETTNISQGQKQLLTIARAILANPPLLILDEATSSVDTRTEILIQKAMDHLMVGRTSFVIAHRLSTIRNADLILVMKDGDIVEQGTHTGLLASGGAYASLYQSQFEGPQVLSDPASGGQPPHA